MSKKIKLFSVALAVFVVALMAFAGTALASYNFTTHTADHSMISDSTSTNKHNVASEGSNPCEYCHIPHGATGAYLWAEPLSASTLGTGAATQGTNVDQAASGKTPYGSDIKPLCYSCHDGTLVLVSSTNTKGLTTVFSANHFNHRTQGASTLAWSGGVVTANPVGPGKDCDRCHDPHDNTTGNYLRPEYSTRTYTDSGVAVSPTLTRWSPTIKGGNFCATCHEMNLPDGPFGASLRNVHPVYQAAGNTVYSTIRNAANPGTYPLVPFLLSNPVPGKNTLLSSWPKDAIFSPATGDYSGTRVFNPSGIGTSSDTTTAVVMCESCHTPHGANDGLAGPAGAQYHMLNTMPEASLCGNCH